MKEIKGHFQEPNKFISESGSMVQVPWNYTSKSRILDGSEMILRINERGYFLFKITKPPEIRKHFAKVVSDRGRLVAETVDTKERLLLIDVSVRFYQLQEGDEIVVSRRADGTGQYCAIELVVPQ